MELYLYFRPRNPQDDTIKKHYPHPGSSDYGSHKGVKMSGPSPPPLYYGVNSGYPSSDPYSAFTSRKYMAHRF